MADPAPALGDTVPVLIRTPSEVDSVYLRSTWDGEPKLAAAVVDEATATTKWWRTAVPVRNPVTRYRFLLDGRRWLNALGETDHDVPDAFDFRLVAGDPPPAWAADAVVYQIFPDRFARSPGADGRTPPPWAIPCAWDDPVIPRGPETPYQLYGGDLEGITGKLDHIAGLGVDAVYLTPFFPAGSSHRYDATAFDRVDPLLGGDAALRRLADAVHARGMRLIGDITTNHCGVAHPWFTEALAGDPAAQSMFYLDGAGGYDTWLGVQSLPKLNWASPELRRRFFDGPSAVAVRWLDRLDGWRVDVANMTGRHGGDDFTVEVAHLMRRAVTAARPDALLVGEHTSDGTADVDRAGWQGTMNYAGFVRPLWTWLRGEALALPEFLGLPGDVPRRSGASVVASMRTFAALVSWQALTTSWNLLGSHDSARVRTIVGAADRHEVAAGLLLTLPGTPMIFAGDELGLTGENGEHSRTPMPWHRPERWDRRTLATYTALIGLRRGHEALRRGGLRWLHASPDALAFVREGVAEDLLVYARRAPGEPVRLTGAEHTAENLYGGASTSIVDGRLVLPGDGPTIQVWRLKPGRRRGRAGRPGTW